MLQFRDWARNCGRRKWQPKWSWNFAWRNRCYFLWILLFYQSGRRIRDHRQLGRRRKRIQSFRWSQCPNKMLADIEAARIVWLLQLSKAEKLVYYLFSQLASWLQMSIVTVNTNYFVYFQFLSWKTESVSKMILSKKKTPKNWFANHVPCKTLDYVLMTNATLHVISI